MLKVDFHCHTIFSKDSLTRPPDLVDVCRRKGLDRVVVTDHNTIAGAQAAHSLDPELVIVGEEILTTRGEILAAYVTEEVPAYLSPKETIKRLKDQGAFISVSHPFDRFRKGAWEEVDLLEIIPDVDAVEVFNSRCIDPRFNEYAKAFAEKHNIPGTVGSDAHAGFELAKSFLLLDPFTGPDEMREVIRGGIPSVRRSPPWVHFASRYAVLYKSFARP